MNKLRLTILVAVFFIISNLSALTVGGLGVFNPNGFSVTGSMGKVEAELSITSLTNSALSLSADYSVFTKGIIDNLYTTISLGAGIGISNSGFNLSIIAPVELVYSIDEILEGLDIYIQAKPIVPLIPITFNFEVGLGVRVGL